jgi:hypothetical protein
MFSSTSSQVREHDSGKEAEHDADGAGEQEAQEDPDESFLKWWQAVVDEALMEARRDGADWWQDLDKPCGRININCRGPRSKSSQHQLPGPQLVH